MTVRIDSLAQEGRVAILHTPLAMDVLALIDFTGHEAVNELYEYTLRVFAPDPSRVVPAELLGKGFRIELNTAAGITRWICGLAISVTPLLSDASAGATYEIELRPWLWLAGLNKRSRGFDSDTMVDLANLVLSDYTGLPQARTNIIPETPGKIDRKYTVQYRESDLDFLRRNLERHGMNFHFEHTEGGATLVIGDANSMFVRLGGGARPFQPADNMTHADGEHFSSWTVRTGLTQEAVRLTDYDPVHPNASMVVNAADPTGRPGLTVRDYDHPAGYLDTGAGEHVARRRLLAFRSQALRIAATGDVMSLGAGQVVTLSALPVDAENRDYIVLECRHHYNAESYVSGSTGGTTSYIAHYELLPADVPVAPLLRTPVARVHGPVLGLVVADAGNDPQNLGRIQVRFHWQDEGKDSMFCRVAQSWAGKGWGAQFLPRVGMEVVVEFLDGDPDMPLVTGCVYNADNTLAFDTGSDLLHSGWRTSSSNQISMDDKSGNERVVVKAQRDMEVTILHDLTEEVDGSVKQRVHGSETIDVNGNILIKSGSTIRLEVGSSYIQISNSEITLKSVNINIVATAELKTDAGAMATHSSGAMMEIKSGLVKIN
jgi:type VI secretion system secreted protein VgrG